MECLIVILIPIGIYLCNFLYKNDKQRSAIKKEEELKKENERKFLQDKSELFDSPDRIAIKNSIHGYVDKYLINKSRDEKEIIEFFISSLFTLFDTEFKGHNPYEAKSEPADDEFYEFIRINHFLIEWPEDWTTTRDDHTLNSGYIFFYDLKKFKKLCLSKGIQTTYVEILICFLNYFYDERHKDVDMYAEKMYQQLYPSIGTEVSVEDVLRKHFLSVEESSLEHLEEGDEAVIEKMGALVRKFQLEIPENFPELISKVAEEVKIERFESSLGSFPKFALTQTQNMNGYEFEEYVTELLSHLGFQSIKRTPKSGDQGGDIIASKDGVKHVIQTKHYNGSVPNKAVQEVVAAKKYYSCEGAIVVTTGEYTRSAMELARVNSVELWDRSVLKNKIDDINEKLRNN